MYKICSFLLSIIITLGFSGLTNTANGINEDDKFIGAKLCAIYHKSETAGKQFVIWESSKHAQAINTLTTAKADKIAKEKGFTTKAAETESCLKCHSTGCNVDASLLTDKFNISDGVQCETCHGPGSEYKTKKIMKDKKISVENRLKIYDNIEEL